MVNRVVNRCDFTLPSRNKYYINTTRITSYRVSLMDTALRSESSGSWFESQSLFFFYDGLDGLQCAYILAREYIMDHFCLIIFFLYRLLHGISDIDAVL